MLPLIVGDAMSIGGQTHHAHVGVLSFTLMMIKKDRVAACYFDLRSVCIVHEGKGWRDESENGRECSVGLLQSSGVQRMFFSRFMHTLKAD